ncbi:MmgE/PrpD family protein [Microbacterium ulmi]|uniref:MmgE/PrpD family protein n=1 Tax=Microbacterium ulmi TaxID=179095 RepID=A0A7Y2LZ19_9MICO|nr:2-methylcitrate dehydratase PrpD [Microbacterium ulmi]NNH03182.1 MmgE/PrpD family protein [Microbacterium ulmi]
MSPDQPPLSRALAAFALGDEPAILDRRGRRLAIPPIVDSVAVILAGNASEAGRASRRYVHAAWPQAAGPGWTSGSDAGLPVELAALINAWMGHALDYDDALPGSGHLSVPMLAAALAAGDAREQPLSGGELVDAFLVGFEIAAKTGMALGVAHYRRGWHTTVTAGTIGTTAAAGRILGLDRDRLTAAFGIAASSVAGLQRNFGTTTKPLHSGLAARNGLAAALLALAGVSSDELAIDGERGLLDLYGLGEARPEFLRTLHEPWAIESPGTGLKLYPACYAAARPVDALLALRARHALHADDVEEIRLAVPKNGLHPMIHHEPKTGLNAKFSMEYVLAAALADGGLDLASFEDAAVSRPAVRELMSRVRLSEDRALRPEDPDALRSSPATGGRVVVELVLRDGRRVEATVAHPKGSPSAPFDRDDLEGKFMTCARFGGFAEEPARAAFDALMELEDVDDVRSVLQTLRPATAGIR